jgi:hypothetical protein
MAGTRKRVNNKSTTRAETKTSARGAVGSKPFTLAERPDAICIQEFEILPFESIATVEHSPDLPLTHTEMFEILVRERAWAFNRGGQLLLDPAGKGRKVGVAAGGHEAGNSVFAVLQVTDVDGRKIALTYGQNNIGAEHAEFVSLERLRPALEGKKYKGGTLTAVIDQEPCPPAKADCRGLLKKFAQEHELGLDVVLPERARLVGQGTVKPRSATMGSHTIDTPTVRLVRREEFSFPPSNRPRGGGRGETGGTPPRSGPGGGGGNVHSPHPTSPPHVPSIDPQLAVRGQKFIIQLAKETREAANQARRFKLYGQAIGALLEALDYLNVYGDAMSMLAHGTVFPDEQQQAEQIKRDAKEVLDNALERYNNTPMTLGADLLNRAIEQRDKGALADLDQQTRLYAESTTPIRQTCEEDATSTALRSSTLLELSRLYKKLVGFPSGLSTAGNAQALAMSESLLHLAGPLSDASQHYKEAAGWLRVQEDWAVGIHTRASQTIAGLALIQHLRKNDEAERERASKERVALRLQIQEIFEGMTGPFEYTPEMLDYARLRISLINAQLRRLEQGIR